MYVNPSDPFGMSNSSTPMSQARIDAQSRRGARIGRNFVRGNQAMGDLVDRMTPPVATGSCDDLTSSLVFRRSWPFPWPAPPGSVVALSESGAGGPGLAPALAGAYGAAAAQAAADAAAAAGGNAPAAGTSGDATQDALSLVPGSPGDSSGGGGSGGAGSGAPGSYWRGWRGRAQPGGFTAGGAGWGIYPRGAVVQAASPLFGGGAGCRPIAIPVPRVTTPQPAVVSQPAAVVAPPPAAPPAPVVVTPPPAAAPASCRTSNICLDIMKGCVSTSQVTPRQYQACAIAGYNSVQMLYPELAGAARPWIGEEDLTPPQMPAGFQVTRATQPSDIPFLDPNVTGLTQLRQQLGLSGVGDLSSVLSSPAVWGAVGLAALLLLVSQRGRR